MIGWEMDIGDDGGVKDSIFNSWENSIISTNISLSHIFPYPDSASTRSAPRGCSRSVSPITV